MFERVGDDARLVRDDATDGDGSRPRELARKRAELDEDVAFGIG